MSKEDNLIPLNSRTPEDRKRIASMGGSTKTELRRYAALINQSHIALCKNCKAACILKESNLEQLKTMVCTIPEARAKAIFYAKPVTDEGVWDKLSHTSLFNLMNLINKKVKDDKFSELKKIELLEKLHNIILKQKDSDYPKIQKNVNLNYGKEVKEVVIRWKGENETINNDEGSSD